MTERTSDRALWLGIIFVVAILVAMLSLLRGARAEEHNHGVLEGWAQRQNVMPAARLRVGCTTDNCTCCAGADIVQSKFRVAKDRSDAWDWVNPVTNRWERVPDDIIHWDEPTPTKEAVMFVYQGTPRCFFPPQDGGG